MEIAKSLSISFFFPSIKTRGRREKKKRGKKGLVMGSSNTELYFVFMHFDPEYERLRADRWVVLAIFLYMFDIPYVVSECVVLVFYFFLK